VGSLRIDLGRIAFAIGRIDFAAGNFEFAIDRCVFTIGENFSDSAACGPAHAKAVTAKRKRAAHLASMSDRDYTAAGTNSAACILRFSGFNSNRKYSDGVTVSTKKVELASPPINANPNAFHMLASA